MGRIVIFGIVWLAMFGLPREAIASLRDLAAVGGDLLVIDGTGQIWRWDEEGVTHDCVWHEVPGVANALAFDFSPTSSGALVGAVATATGTLEVVQYLNGALAVSATYALPVSTVVDIGASAGGPYWIQSAPDELYFLRSVGGNWTWFGPCTGIGGPTALGAKSWSRVKGDFR